MKKPQTKLVLNKGASIKKVIRLTESQFRKLVKVMSESVLDPQGEKDQPLRHSPGIGNDPDNLESSDELWNDLISGEEYVEDKRSPEEKYEDFVRDHGTARSREPWKRDDREHYEPKDRLPVPLPNDSPDWNRGEFDDFQAHTDKQLKYGETPEEDLDHPGFNHTPWITRKS